MTAGSDLISVLLHLQLSQSVVTLLLTWSLLRAHSDELVDAVCDGPEDRGPKTL